jgi:hypothetical protein
MLEAYLRIDCSRKVDVISLRVLMASRVSKLVMILEYFVSKSTISIDRISNVLRERDPHGNGLVCEVFREEI